MTNASRYPARVFWSDADAGYIALAPDLPGCSAFGSSQGEAITELQDAIDAWIEAARSAGNPIPEPSPMPLPEPAASGRVLLRLPKTLHERLQVEALREGTSMNQLVLYLLAQSLPAPAQRSGQVAVNAAPQSSNNIVVVTRTSGSSIDYGTPRHFSLASASFNAPIYVSDPDDSPEGYQLLTTAIGGQESAVFLKRALSGH